MVQDAARLAGTGAACESRDILRAFAFDIKDAPLSSTAGGTPSGIRPREVAIIGDNFMLPETFEQAIRNACGATVAIRTMRLPFPDEPLKQRDVKLGMGRYCSCQM